MVEDWSNNATMNKPGACTYPTAEGAAGKNSRSHASTNSNASSFSSSSSGGDGGGSSAWPSTTQTVSLDDAENAVRLQRRQRAGGMPRQQQQRVHARTRAGNPAGSPVLPGSLFNAMVQPWVNYTIKGAVWYQGENNVFQCVDGALGDPTLCGSAANGTGYGCFLKSMVETWRQWWSEAPLSSTSSKFPFGVVSLAGSTSEGHSNAMPAFRNAQTAGGGLLPSAAMPNTFVAQAFDAGEPAGGDPNNGNSCSRNWETDSAGYSCRRVICFSFP